MCNCRITEIVLGAIILIFALWPVRYSPWIISIAAVILIIHALACPNCSAWSKETKKSAKRGR
ncbi:hypothetical protein J4461_01235 [Candidatus Pacearchaeota archaeon]|nr:hypothetical protein [Candidatus Pacearchaeota archaeon]